MTQSYYETMYILRPDIPEEEVESHVTKYRDLVTESGGQVLDCQMRGKRRLAYPITKHREGIYVQLNHDGDGQQVSPLERAMRLSEDVIRYLTVKQDGPMPAPRTLPGESNEAPAPAAASAAAATAAPAS
jgi:small subunit ribosomal protein S6